MSMRKKSLRQRIGKKIEVVEYVCAWTLISFMIVGFGYYQNRALYKEHKRRDKYNV